MLLFGDSMQRTVARSFFFYAGLLSRERGASRGDGVNWGEL